VGAQGLTIGRRSDCDIVVDTDLASRKHARIVTQGNECLIVDLDSLNGTYLNGERLRSELRRLSDGDTVVVGGESLRFLSGGETKLAQRSMPVHGVRAVHLQSQRVTIGRDPGNDVVLDDPNVSRYHAELASNAAGVELKDLASTNGSRLNGEIVDRAVLETGDELGIGPFRLIFDGRGVTARDDRGGLRLDAEQVSMTIKEKQILAPTTLSVAPGQLVAVIGSSGAGKSTLVRTLAGVTRPTSGSVLLSGDPIAARRTDVGYVPQEDIVHRRLTVLEALRYAARLRLPEDSSPADVEAAVGGVLDELGLTEHANTLIGSLSGGQRKRVGVATELLSRPGVVCLDEPTTGLDPALEARTMGLLRRLADESRAVIVVTHATASLDLCDRLAVMGAGGHLCFFGSPAEALAFFGASRLEDVYVRLEERPVTEWQARYDTEHRVPGGDGTERFAAVAAAGVPRPSVPGPPRRRLVPQASLLTRRYVRLFGRDRRNLLILLGQVPLLALALVGLFEADVFSRDARTPNEAAQLLFLMVTTALWIGSIDAAREIIKERNVLASERAVGLRLGAYIASKAAVLFVLATVQTLVLAAIVLGLRPLDEPSSTLAAVVGLLLLTSLVAVSMGLAVSAAVNTEEQATSFIPLTLLPQLLFAGALVPVARMGDALGALSAFIFARWSFAGAGSAIDMNGRLRDDPRSRRVNRYGLDFFDVSADASALVLLVFLGVLLGGVALLMVRRAR